MLCAVELLEGVRRMLKAAEGGLGLLDVAGGAGEYAPCTALYAGSRRG